MTVKSNGTNISVYFDDVKQYEFGSTAKLESISANFEQYKSLEDKNNFKYVAYQL